MLRRKTEQLHREEQDQTTTSSLTVFRSKLRRRGLALGAALALLVGVLIAGTVAWYTQLSNITGMTMKAAKIDIRANYVEDTVIINAGDYLNVSGNKAAPGTKGVIPIRLDAAGSEVDVDYTVSLNFSSMADEFKNRIRFYYYKEVDGTTYEVTVDPATAAATASAISGKVALGAVNAVNYEYIYWEWVYELDDDWFCSDGVWYYKGEGEVDDPLRVDVTLETDKAEGAETLFNTLYPDTPASGGSQDDTVLSKAIDDFDEFDSLIGTGEADEELTAHLNGEATDYQHDAGAVEGTVPNLKAYQQAMLVKLYVTGAQATPIPTGATPGTTTGSGTIYRGTIS